MKYRWRILCVLIAPLVCASIAQGVERKVFIFGGQSNMAGADAIINGTGTQDLAQLGLQTEADKNTLFSYSLGLDSITYPTNSPGYGWGDIRGHLGSSFSAPGFYVHGPEVGFARNLYAQGIDNMAIVAVSDNISTLGPPWPWTSTSGANDYYAQWSSFVNARLAELTSNGDTYTVAGFVWDEGIDDAILGSTQSQYQTNLSSLINQLRSDYGTATTPFVIVQSKSPAPSPTAMQAVRAAQQAVAAADPFALLVSTDDVPNVNTHHFSAASQLIIGDRVGDAYLALVPEPSTLSMAIVCIAVGLFVSALAGIRAWFRQRRVPEMNPVQ